MMKKMMFVFALMLIPMQSHAATAFVEVDPTALRVSSSGSKFYLYFEPLPTGTDPNNCGDLDSATSPTSDNWQIVHATILAGLLADKLLRIRFNGCSGARPLFDFVEIYK